MLNNVPLTDTYTFENGVVSPSVNLSGKLPKNGTATVASNCNVILNITDGEYTAVKESLDLDITIEDGDQVGSGPMVYTVYTDGTPVYFNPTTGEKCTAGQAVSTPGTTTGCLKWYTFNDGGSSIDVINLLLDHNIDAMVGWNSSGSNVSGANEVLSSLQTRTNAWVGVPTRTDSYTVNNGTANYTINYNNYKARLITADEISNITGNPIFNSLTSPTSAWF